MYLLDTHVVSELRKRERADPGIRHFFSQLGQEADQAWISVITLGELRRGVERIRHRGDRDQARALESWLHKLLDEYADHVLDFGPEEAQLWGRLRVPHPENALDKQIAATALIRDLILVTRNTSDLRNTGGRLLNPFA